MSFCQINYGSYWRPEEFEAIKEYFGEIISYPKGDFLFWRINTESLNRKQYDIAIEKENIFQGHIVNPISTYIYTDAKDACLAIWNKHELPIPEYFTYSDIKDFEKKFNSSGFNYPIILKINDNTGGLDTFLIDKYEEILPALNQIEKAYQIRKKQRNLFTKKMCVKFIDISIEKGRSTAFRAVVSGGKIVCMHPKIGTTRLAENYATFSDEIKNIFIEQCIRAIKLKEKYDKIILKAVSVLNLHYVAVDLIADKEDNIYLLEVQPFYSCGNPIKSYPSHWPFNPSLPENLVNWLISDKEILYPQISHFYDNWLDRKNHFNLVYKYLLEYFR